MRKFILYLLLCTPMATFAEGGKNLTPANSGSATGGNQFIGYLQNGDGNNSLSFLGAPTETGYSADHRLLIRIKPGERLYYGLQRNDGTGNTVRIQLRRTDNGVIVATTDLTSTTNPALNTATGVISSYAAMVAGPSAIVGASGYNALSYIFPASETSPVDLAVEILDDGTSPNLSASTARDWYNLWDFSVYDGSTERTGRLHAKYWSFSAAAGNNRLSTNFRMYTAAPNQSGNEYYIKSISLGGMQPFGFFFTSNETGTLTDASGVATADYKKRRKSRNFYSGVFDDGYPQYHNFVNNPDIEFWPSATILNPVITPVSKCHPSRTGGGAMDISVTVTMPGVVLVLLDLNGTDGYQPGTTDVLIEQEIPGTGTSIVFWNGFDGLGNNVPSGTAFKTIFRYGSYPVHYPIYDAENNNPGFAMFDERPSAPGSPAIAFWDDSSVVAGSAQIFGVTSIGSVHPWGGGGTGILTSDIGDTKLFNTWMYGQLREFNNYYLHVYNCSGNPPVANNFTNQPILQTAGPTPIPGLSATDADGTIASFTVSNPPASSQGILYYCPNAPAACTAGQLVAITGTTTLTPAQAASLQFDPAPGYTGSAEFNFTATDNHGNISNTATYILPVVANPPVANNIVSVTMPNTNGPTAIPPFVATDADGTITNYTVATIPTPSQGVLSYCPLAPAACTAGQYVNITANTTLTPAQMETLQFDPAPGFTGNAPFTYTATDNSGNISNTATYTIPVSAIPNYQTPPLVNNITAPPVNNSSGNTPIPALSGSDVDGTVVSYTVHSIPPASQGVLYYCPLAPAACTAGQLVAVTAGQTLTPDQAGSLQFDPLPTFTGVATFNYTATDNSGNVGNNAVYNIPVVNQPPTVVNITTTVPYNAAHTAIPPISGSDADGTITSYTVTNIPPAAQGVLYYCPLAPATCTTGQLQAVTAGSSLTPAQANSLYFDPANGFSGNTTFTYTATDNNGNVSQPGNYTIGISNQPPVANNITLPSMPNTNGATAIPALSATDPDGTIAQYTIHTLPPASQGVLLLNGNPVTAGQTLTPAQISQLQFDPAAGFTGIATFTYSATDNGGNYSNLANYNIPVSGTGNLPPIANPIVAPAMSNSNGATGIPPLVATDPDGSIASYTIETLPPAFQGVLLLNGSPVTPGQILTPAQINQLQFDPAPGFTGQALFEYSATDNSGIKSNFTTYTIPVTNVPPAALAIIAPVMPSTNGPTPIPSLSATDADGTVTSYTISTLPPASQGVLLLNGNPVTPGQVLTPAQISQLQFDPAPDYNGEVVFNYFATDNNGNNSNTATYTLNTTGLPPVSQNVTAPAIVNTSGPTSIPGLNSADPDGTISSYTILNIPPASQGVLLLNGNPVTPGQTLTPAQISQLQFDPAPGFVGIVQFNYTAVDNSANTSNTATYNIPVNTGGVLPVSLLLFNGRLNGSVTDLNWSTSQEINSSYFDVLKSTDGITYNSIGNVAAAGNSNTQKHYSFTDVQPANGVNYYRLKVVDIDGSFEYSDIVTIRLSNQMRVAVWPNPFAEKIQVNVDQHAAAKLQLVLRDMQGRQLKTQLVTTQRGTNQFSIDGLGNLPAGMYVLELKDAVNATSQRIKILKK